MKKGSHTSLDVFVLCGGLGTRIRSKLPDIPKVLAPIRQTTYLDILLEKLKQAGFKRVILGIGYLGEQIKEYVSSNSLDEDLDIVFSGEDTPLGTGGAVKNAEKYIGSDDFIVINGDTLFDVDFAGMHDAHRKNNAIVTMAVSERAGGEGGSVFTDEAMRITGFREKDAKADTKFVSAGVYMMSKKLLGEVNSEPFLLEIDLFPSILDKRFYAFRANRDFLDIGTPEQYREAENY